MSLAAVGLGLGWVQEGAEALAEDRAKGSCQGCHWRGWVFSGQKSTQEGSPGHRGTRKGLQSAKCVRESSPP